MNNRRQAILGFLEEARVATGSKDLTSLARGSKLTPSTLTRFANTDVPHNLSYTTLSKVSDYSKVPIPGSLRSDLDDEKLIEAFKAMRGVLKRLAPSVTDEQEGRLLLAGYYFLMDNPDEDPEKGILYYLASNPLKKNLP